MAQTKRVVDRTYHFVFNDVPEGHSIYPLDHRNLSGPMKRAEEAHRRMAINLADITRAAELCSQLRPDMSSLERQAFLNTALFRYMRCFEPGHSNGSRAKTLDVRHIFTAEERRIHFAMKAARNNYVAHDAREYHFCATFLMIDPDGNAVDMNPAILDTPSTVSVIHENLPRMVEKAREWILAEAIKAKDAILAAWERPAPERRAQMGNGPGTVTLPIYKNVPINEVVPEPRPVERLIIR